MPCWLLTGRNKILPGFVFQGTNLGKSSSCHSSFTSTFSIRKVASVVPIVPREGPAAQRFPRGRAQAGRGKAERLALSIVAGERFIRTAQSRDLLPCSAEKQRDRCSFRKPTG